jgi:pyridoxine 5-phosphate synthase
MPIKLSVNVNKVATLRNSRGGAIPSVVDAVRTCVAAGAPGITVHPRQDERHIRAADVREIAALLASIRGPSGGEIEFNIEGDPRPDLLELVLAVRPTQCTLVPVTPGEITSHAGWRPGTSVEWMRGIVSRLHGAGVRVSLFVDPDERGIDWAATTGAERVELYTEPYARAFAAGDGPGSFDNYRRAALRAHAAGLGINAGHDLDLANLTLFRSLPHLAEVSIGHALISHALWVGLDRAVRDYLAAVAL